LEIYHFEFKQNGEAVKIGLKPESSAVFMKLESIALSVC